MRMSRWDVQDGLIHFLFANEDQYILDSMIALDLTGYLNYELQRRHFKRILFISGLEGSFAVRIFHQDTWNWMTERMKGPFGLSLRSKPEFCPDQKGMVLNCSAEQIRKLPDQAKNTAFVISLDSFAEIFFGCAEQLKNAQRLNTHNRNLMILRSGVTSKESQPYFQDPKGIFSEETLFPEIVTAFNEEDSPEDGCYYRMKQLLGDRCEFLNRFSKKAIGRVVSYFDWLCRMEPLFWTAKEKEVLSEYIWKWYHDAREQLRAEDFLSENPMRSYQILLRDLGKHAKEILKAAQDINRNESPAEPLPEPGVIADSLFVRQVPEQFYEVQDPEKRMQFESDCAMIRRELRKPSARKPKEEMKKHLEFLLTSLSAAVKNGDSETFRQAKEGILSVTKCRYRTDENSCSLQKAAVSQSAMLFDVQRKLKNDAKRISEIDKELFGIMERDIGKLGASERAAEANRALNLKKEKESLEGMIRKNTKEEADIRAHLLQISNGLDLWKQKQSEKKTFQIGQMLQDLLNSFI